MKGIVISAKTKKILIYIASALLIYSIIGFLIIPAVISNQIPKITKDQFNRISKIEEVKFNPFSMELDLQGLELKNRDPSTFVSFDRLYVNLGVVKSIFDLTLTVDRIMLNKLYIQVQRDKQGDFNFTDLISKKEEEKEQPKDEGIFPVTIAKFSIAEAKFDWEDDYYSQPQKETIYPLNLTADNLTTVQNKQSDLGFSLAFGSGGTFDWNGQLEITPLNSKGHIKLDKLGFQKVWELFIQDSVNFEVLKGSELVELDYHLTDTDKGIQFLINNAHIDIVDVQISEKGIKEPVINIPDFKISGIAFDLLKKDVTINKVSAKQAEFNAWLNAEGEINYQSLFAPKTEKQPEPQQKPDSTDDEVPWSVLVKQVEIGDFAFNFVDKSLPEDPANINISAFNLNATELSNKPGAELPFDLGLTLNKSGQLKIQGNTILAPFSSKLEININDIALNDFQPYVNKFANLDIISGLFNASANVSVKQEENKPLDLIIKGDSNIAKLVTRDQISNKDFLNWNQLSLNKIDLNLAANSYLIDSIKIEKPYTRILIRKDKTINVNDIAKKTDDKKEAKTENEDKEQPATEEKNKPTFKIAKFEIVEGESDFSDLSLILPFSAHINQLKGNVKGISSDEKAVINANFNGRVANLAPVKIKGKISPNTGNSNFDLDFKSMPLPLVTPYMAEFAGRKIEKGNMSLNLKYKIQNQQLTASNNLLIDQLVLGEEVDNPDAVSLPLGLAIALLEDSEGKIKLDMPVTGSLDDPQFSIGGLIFDTLVNVITKIVASPFNAVASLIDSEEDISKINFVAGKSELDEKQRYKLDQLTNALAQRPALKLEIKGAAFSEEDWPQLQAEALNNQLVKIRADEMSKENGKTVLPEHIKLTEEESQDLLADLFIKKYPDLAKRSLFGTPKLINAEDKDFYEVAQTRLAAEIPPDRERLEKLAVARAQSIAKHLNSKELSVDRVFLLNAEVDPVVEDTDNSDPKDAENKIAASLNLTTK